MGTRSQKTPRYKNPKINLHISNNEKLIDLLIRELKIVFF